jgi:3-deoxy-D-manno-octulosonic-acid transferase
MKDKHIPIDHPFFHLYQLLWRLAIPLLKHNPRLKGSFKPRVEPWPLLANADLWIQAASAGEAYLANELIANLQPAAPLKVLVTTNTEQGMQILKAYARSPKRPHDGCRIRHTYLPFDKPDHMSLAMRYVSPKVLVLVETEIWPALMAAARQHQVRILLLNGRLTMRSLRRYRLWPSLWPRLSPDHIQAVSPNDTARYRALFGAIPIETVSNIKFDRIDLDSDLYPAEDRSQINNPAGHPFIVMGSIRKQEEASILWVIKQLLQHQEMISIGLFPRHMERVHAWQRLLTDHLIDWTLRSRSLSQIPRGIILWDRFGELASAYAACRTAFVGGSLAPLGGQNFLEPLIHGIVPVIGPSWSNFHWVGSEIISQKLLRIGSTKREVAEILLQHLSNPPAKKPVRKAAIQYIRQRQGGLRQACSLIHRFLDSR